MPTARGLRTLHAFSRGAALLLAPQRACVRHGGCTGLPVKTRLQGQASRGATLAMLGAANQGLCLQVCLLKGAVQPRSAM